MAAKIALFVCFISIYINCCVSADAVFEKEQGCTQYIKDVYAKWVEFRKKFNPTYADSNEEIRRFGIFVTNVQDIDKHNREAAAGKHTWTKGINQFADKTSAELSRPCSIPPGQTAPPAGCVGK